MARAFDFYIIDTKKKPKSILKKAAKDVFGNYSAQKEYDSGTECGLLAMSLGRPGLRIVKFDIGPWPWYTDASRAVAVALCKSLNATVWMCGYLIDEEYSYVKCIVPEKSGPVIRDEVGNINGPQLSSFVLGKWGLDLKFCAQELKDRAMWETKRRWLITDPAKRGNTILNSFMIGRLLLRGDEQAHMLDDWHETWGNRKPEDGPLHEQLYFKATSDVEKHRPKKPKFVFEKEGRVEIYSELGSDGNFHTTDVKRTGAKISGPAGLDFLSGEDPNSVSKEEIKHSKSRISTFLSRIKNR